MRQANRHAKIREQDKIKELQARKPPRSNQDIKSRDNSQKDRETSKQ
jgi:hypothetical protein